MAGILDSKSRVIDFFVTTEGRRQASTGQMKFKFATFTDMHTFYAASGSSDPDVAEDASGRIFFEAGNRFQDVVVPELQAGQSMRPFRTEDFVFDGKVLASGTFKKGFQTRYNLITGSLLTGNSAKILNGITKNFVDQRILGTEDPFADSTGFIIKPTTGSFYVNDSTLLSKCAQSLDPVTGESNQQTDGTAVLETIPSLFGDNRFSHFSNFLYLPPVNELQVGELTPTPLGIYPVLNDQPDSLTSTALNSLLQKRSSFDIYFDETSRDNNLICQMFEFTENNIEKLSIIDFGEFTDTDPLSPGYRVFFIGKVLRDGNGTETFLNIFTVVFD